MSPRTDASPRQTCLGEVVLKDAYLLPKVLEHLVDDGLHECRRVCRKWRDVCSLLPVKLVDVRAPKFRDVARILPYATSVSVTVDRECNSEEFCEFISSFTRIKRLHLRDAELSHDFLSSAWLDICSLPSHAPFLSQLESLTLRSRFMNSRLWIWMVREHLTNLAHLEITGNCFIRRWNVDPLPETHKLKSLSIKANYLFNREGTLIFPPSETLTRLEVNPGPLFTNCFLEVRERIRKLSAHEIDRVSRY